MGEDRPNVRPVHLLKRNRPAGVVLREEHYRRLHHQASQAPAPEISSLEWLLQQASSIPGRSKAEIDAELVEERHW
jgi:hypothetical protein